jgi:hypothetical protein
LPSKKIITSLLLVLIATGTGFYLFKFKKPLQKDKLQNSLISIAKNAGEIDSDKDGLKDWEEVLWKTDINNPDSDGDGYSDKQETDGGYSPTDILSNKKTGKKNQNEFGVDNSFGSENITQVLSKNIAQQITSNIGKDGELPNFSNPLTLVDQGTNKGMVEFMADLNARIPESEFKKSEDNSTEAVQKYTDSVFTLFPKPPSFNSAFWDELVRAVQYKDYKMIDAITESCSQIIVGLKEITVPSDFFLIHKRFTEIFTTELKIFKSIKNFENDPLKALIAVEQEEKTMNELEGLFANFINLIKKHGIQ